MNYYLEQYKIVYKSVAEGHYFGEYEVIKRILRVNTIRVQTNSNMLYLLKKDFLNLIENDYPDFYTTMESRSDVKNESIGKRMNFALKAANNKMYLLTIKATAHLRNGRRGSL